MFILDSRYFQCSLFLNWDGVNLSNQLDTTPPIAFDIAHRHATGTIRHLFRARNWPDPFMVFWGTVVWKLHLFVKGCWTKYRGKKPKLMVHFMENPIKMDDLGVPLFLETSKTRKRMGNFLKSSKLQVNPNSSPDLKLLRLYSRTNGVQCCQRSNQTSSRAGNWKSQRFTMIYLDSKTHGCKQNNGNSIQLLLHILPFVSIFWSSVCTTKSSCYRLWLYITFKNFYSPNYHENVPKRCFNSYNATKPFGTRTTCTTCVLCTIHSCESWSLSAWTNHAPNPPSQGQSMARYSAVAASTNTLIWISRTFAQYRPEHFMPVETWRMIVWPHESCASSMPKCLKRQSQIDFKVKRLYNTMWSNLHVPFTSFCKLRTVPMQKQSTAFPTGSTPLPPGNCGSKTHSSGRRREKGD